MLYIDVQRSMLKSRLSEVSMISYHKDMALQNKQSSLSLAGHQDHSAWCPKNRHISQFVIKMHQFNIYVRFWVGSLLSSWRVNVKTRNSFQQSKLFKVNWAQRAQKNSNCLQIYFAWHYFGFIYSYLKIPFKYLSSSETLHLNYPANKAL